MPTAGLSDGGEIDYRDAARAAFTKLSQAVEQATVVSAVDAWLYPARPLNAQRTVQGPQCYGTGRWWR